VRLRGKGEGGGGRINEGCSGRRGGSRREVAWERDEGTVREKNE